MKQNRFAEEQIFWILKQHEAEYRAQVQSGVWLNFSIIYLTPEQVRYSRPRNLRKDQSKAIGSLLYLM